MVEGHQLEKDELRVASYFENATGNMDSCTSGEALVILNLEMDQSLMDEAIAREFVNRVQRLRKKAGLKPTDHVETYYEFLDAAANPVKSVLEGGHEFLKKAFKNEPRSGPRPTHAKPIIFEEQEVNEVRLNLYLFAGGY